MARTKKMSATEERIHKANLERMTVDAMTNTDGRHDLALAEDADFCHRRWDWTIQLLTREMDNAKATVAKFAAKLAEGSSPAYEFAWGTDVVKAAAVVEVYGAFLAVLTERGIETAREFGRERTFQAAREAFPRSTSAMSNLVDAARAEVWATLTGRSYGSASYVFGDRW